MIANTSAKSAATSSSTTADTGRRGGVAQLDLLVPDRSELATTDHEHPRIGLVMGDRSPDERAPAGVRQADGKRLDRDATDEQTRLAEHSHVGEEHTVRRVGAEVAGSTAEAERLTVDERDEAGRIAETRRFTGEYPWARLRLRRRHCFYPA